MFELKLVNESASIVDINDGINYLVLSCTGLNPPSAEIFTAKSPNKKGSRYNGSSLNERYITVQIKLLGDVETSRNALYAWIDTEQYVKIIYRNGIKNVYCEGHVQDCDIDFFTDNELVNLAIICENPYWKNLEAIRTDISDVLGNFVFPFAIDSSGIPFSSIRESSAATIFNSGAETGINIIIQCNGNVANITIFDNKDTTKKFLIKKTFSKGTQIIIDTEASPKTVKAHYANGTTENLMKYVGSNPTWFTLKKGYNEIGYSAVLGGENINVSIAYTQKYLGV